MSMQTNELTTRIINLQNNQYKFVPDTCPDEITFDMLNKELRPETEYKDSKQNRDILWKSYYIVCLSPDPFGFYIETHELKNINSNTMIPWYTMPSKRMS
uniref:Uncharacterized protein n=1 Tax=viral metagenome TaxID=1070528 RepID=A0A6C0JTU9_9ZZZZ